MRIWIDLANSPHVPFFAPLIVDFQEKKHEVLITCRDFAQTIELAERYGLGFEQIGGHGGAGLFGKFENLLGRALKLRRWAKGKNIDLAVSHNSYSQILAAKLLGIKSVTLMDYEHQPANHLAFRMANRIIVPESFPEEALNKFGASKRRVFKYAGIKEDVYLADFEPDENFEKELKDIGITQDKIIVVLRPPADFALYHRFENELFESLLIKLEENEAVKAVFLARTTGQKEEYRMKLRAGKFIFPKHALDGANLIASADLVISAGGTMNREAAALGIPAATIYAGKSASIDEFLAGEKRLIKIEDAEGLKNLKIAKKEKAEMRRNLGLREKVGDLILGAIAPK